MTHICISKLASIVSDNGLSPGRRQAIIWTNAGILLIGPLGTNFSEISIEIHTFSFKKMHFKMSSGKWQPFSLGLNVLRRLYLSLSNMLKWFCLTHCIIRKAQCNTKAHIRNHKTQVFIDVHIFVLHSLLMYHFSSHTVGWHSRNYTKWEFV